MNINQLKYFVSVAEKRSFSQAAKENFITQTAITQQIQQLEEDIGTTLIDRKVRPVQLTHAGAVFYKEARELVSRIDFAIVRAKEASKGCSGRINIGYTKGYERSDLSIVLKHFHDRYPGVFVHCERNSTDVLASQLLVGELDMVVTWDSTGLQSDSKVDSILIEDSPLVGVFYNSHPLAIRDTIQRSDFKGEPMLYMSPSADPNSLGEAYFLNLYQQAGFIPDIRAYTTDAESIMMMVAAEEGVSILPAYYTRKLEHADNLAFVPVVGEGEIESIHAFKLKDNNNAALKDLWEMLKN